MTRVSIHHEPADSESLAFRAVAGQNQAKGRTAGEALDALAAQLPHEGPNTLVIVRSMGPDRFFSSEQCQRLEQLVALRNEALSQGSRLHPEEQAELERLVDAEVAASAARGCLAS
jgi:tryptophan 2,3-dioxygenase